MNERQKFEKAKYEAFVKHQIEGENEFECCPFAMFDEGWNACAESKQAEIDSLTRKLAEQQAIMFSGLGLTNELREELCMTAKECGGEELNKLLAEARADAYAKLDFMVQLKGENAGRLAVVYTGMDGGFTIIKWCPNSLIKAEARAEGSKVPEEASDILSEAADIIAGTRELREPIVDELRGFSAMLSAAPKKSGE